MLELPEVRTSPDEAIAGAADSKSLFVGRDDLAAGEDNPPPQRGQLVIYSLTPPGAQSTAGAAVARAA